MAMIARLVSKLPVSLALTALHKTWPACLAHLVSPVVPKLELPQFVPVVLMLSDRPPLALPALQTITARRETLTAHPCHQVSRSILVQMV